MEPRRPRKPFMPAFGTPKLSLIMSALFVCLSIPILIFILLYNYHKNSEAIASTLEQSVNKTIQSNIESAGNFIHPVGGMLRLLAGIAAVDPAYFRTEASADLLYRALISGEQVDAVYVSFEDGYHRVVTRMDEDRRRSDPKIPSNANWHSSYIDDFSVGKDRARHRLFFENWGHSVGGYSVPSNLDIRTLEGYAQARSTRGLVITEPTINPDTGIADPVGPLPDHPQRRIHRHGQRQYHDGCALALSGEPPCQPQQQKHHRRHEQRQDHRRRRPRSRRADDQRQAHGRDHRRHSRSECEEGGSHPHADP